MKRTLFAAACLAMLLASCGPSQKSLNAQERLTNFALGKGFNLDPRPPPDEDEPDETPSDPNPSPSQPSPAIISLTQLQRLVGGSPPVETAVEQDRRARQVFSRSDSYLETAVYFDAHRADLPDEVSTVRCSGTSCTHTFPDGDIEISRLSSPNNRIGTTLLTHNGITIESLNYVVASSVVEGRSSQMEVIGSTLHNSYFGSVNQYRLETAGWNYDDSARWSVVYGDLTGSGPSVSGTWRGMATAVTKQNDDLLLGDAELRYTASATGGSLEAEFGPFVNVTKARATTPLAIVFSNIQVRSDGTFNFSGSSNRRLQGAFYGNAHAEAAGVFEHPLGVDLLGAFGTKR